VTLRPRLRADLVVRKMTSGAEPYVIVKDPETQEYYKYENWACDLFELLDGSRDLDDLCVDFDAIRPELNVGPQWMVDHVDGLHATGLLERTEREKHLVMMDKLETLRRRRLYHVQSVFEINFPLFDPNDLLDRFMPWIRWIWSPWHVALWAAAFSVVFGFLVYHWDLYWAGLWALYNPVENTIWDWLGLIALMCGIAVWHEFGHGFTCKRFGGEVHDIGFMIFYFEPAFYCNIDDSYLFPKLSHRIYCAMGGPYFELMLCSAAVAVWLSTPAEWWIHGLAMATVLISGISVLFNFNPLLKLDGYYALMDWLDIPELREESFRYVRSSVRKHLFRLPVTERPISRRRRKIYRNYGIVAFVYTALVLWLAYMFVHGWLVGWLGPVGYLILFGLIFLLTRRKLVAGARFLRHLWLDKREWLLSMRGRAAIGAVFVILALLLFVPRSATRIEAAFTVEPGSRAVVRAPADAVVRLVNVSEGEQVARGEVLAVLESPDLEVRGRRAASDREQMLREAAESRLAGDVVTARERFEEAAEAGVRVRLLDRRLEELTLTAPISGLVTTPEFELRSTLGRYLDRGEPLCTVDRLDTVRLAVSALESDVAEIDEGATVRMLATAYPGRTLRASVLALAPVAEPPAPEEAEMLDLVQRVNLVRVLVEVDNPERRLLPGMSGRVQFLTRPRSPAAKAWWRFRRWASMVIW
jgi:putative peptide zinc metalloprotease protein